MKLFTVIILIISIVSSAVNDGAVYIDFKINQDYYTVNHCVNTQKPELLCSGKCYLGEKLQKSVDLEKTIPVSKRQIKSVIYIVPDKIKIPLPELIHKLKLGELIKNIPNFFDSNFLARAFHPPQFL